MKRRGAAASLRGDGTLCSVEGCERPARRGRQVLCTAHYARWRRTGDARPGDPIRQPNRSPLERLMSFVQHNEETGCWEWQGQRDAQEYGRFHLIGPVAVPAHRAAWLLLRGPIPDGLQIDHLCRVRCCVNPDHLEPVTLQENVRRAMPFRPEYVLDEDRLRKVCKNGHPMSGDNLGRRPNGGRKCLACMREYQRAYLARKAAS